MDFQENHDQVFVLIQNLQALHAEELHLPRKTGIFDAVFEQESKFIASSSFYTRSSFVHVTAEAMQKLSMNNKMNSTSVTGFQHQTHIRHQVPNMTIKNILN